MAAQQTLAQLILERQASQLLSLFRITSEGLVMAVNASTTDDGATWRSLDGTKAAWRVVLDPTTDKVTFERAAASAGALSWTKVFSFVSGSAESPDGNVKIRNNTETIPGLTITASGSNRMLLDCNVSGGGNAHRLDVDSAGNVVASWGNGGADDILFLIANNIIRNGNVMTPSGNRFFQMINTTSAPGTPTGSGCMYSAAGAGHWKGSSGTDTTFGPAEPHCTKCDSDFVTAHLNLRWGIQVIECRWCGHVERRQRARKGGAFKTIRGVGGRIRRDADLRSTPERLREECGDWVDHLVDLTWLLAS